MALKLLTAAAEEPVTLAEAKLHCRVDGTDDDALFTGVIIPAARESAEHRTGRALVTQKWELSLEAFPAGAFDLPKPPLQSVESIKYRDTAGNLQTLGPAAYTVHTSSLAGKVAPAYGTSWPATRGQLDAVTVSFTAGYGDRSTVPAGLKSWILLAIGTLYENREAFASGQVIELPGGFWDRLLDPYLVWRAV